MRARGCAEGEYFSPFGLRAPVNRPRRRSGPRTSKVESLDSTDRSSFVNSTTLASDSLPPSKSVTACRFSPAERLPIIRNDVSVVSTRMAANDRREDSSSSSSSPSTPPPSSAAAAESPEMAESASASAPASIPSDSRFALPESAPRREDAGRPSGLIRSAKPSRHASDTARSTRSMSVSRMCASSSIVARSLEATKTE